MIGREAGQPEKKGLDCAVRNHYTAGEEEKAPPEAAFSRQAAGRGYNPREAGQPDKIGLDCAVRNHYTTERRA